MFKRILVILIAALLSNAAIFCHDGEKPVNVIFLIGDGMGNSYVSASVLSDKDSQFRHFTTVGLTVTCAADKLITDSAAAGTALATGSRTDNGVVGLNPEMERLISTLEVAEKNGYHTGIISTSSITHATPASFYAHVEARKMENEIAEQFIPSGIEIAIGAGRDFFLPENEGGKREDSKNVITELKNKGYEYFAEYEKLAEYKGDKPVISLLDGKSLVQGQKRDYSLGDLTKIAIDRLAGSGKGFFLMVEGSQIDWAGHGNDEDYAKSELTDFNQAIKVALAFAEADGHTLVVVTADHETGGMAITNGDKDGSDLEFTFGSKGHTPVMVPVFAKGPGEKSFGGVINNYQIGKTMKEFFKK